MCVPNFCVALFASIGIVAASEAQITYETVAVFDGEQGLTLRNAVISPDFQSIAAALRDKSGQEFISINGTRGAFFDRILPRTLQWTADSKSIYYAAERAKKQYIVAGTKEIAVSGSLRNDSFYRTPTLTVDSKTAFWITRQGTKSVLFRDGEELPYQFDDILALESFGNDGVVILSRTSCRRAYRNWPERGLLLDFDGVTSLRFNVPRQAYLYTGTNSGTNLLVDQDGHEVARSDSEFIFFSVSPDGKRKFVMTSELTATAFKTRVTVSGLSDMEFDGEDMAAAQVAFSQDSSRVLYSVADGDKQAVLLDGKLLSRWFMVAPSSMQWSSDGTRFAYIAIDDERKSRVVDQSGKAMTEDNVVPGSLVINNKTLAYVASAVKGNQAVNKQVVVNGKRDAMKFDEIGHILLLPEGRAAYVGRKGGIATLVVAGKSLRLDADQVYDSTLRLISDASIAVLTRKDNTFRTAIANPLK